MTTPTHDPVYDYGLPALDQVFREIGFPEGFYELQHDTPFAFMLSRHGTVVLTEYPEVHRRLPSLHLSFPCIACGARTVSTELDGRRFCAKCGEPRVL